MSPKDDPSSASTDLRRLLLEKAREILRDPEEPPLALRTVARSAGKSRTAPYLAFGKESDGGGLLGLKIAVAAQGAREMADHMGAAVAAHTTPLEAFQAAALAFLEFVEREPRLFRLMYGPDIAAIRHVGEAGFVLHPEFEQLARHRGRASDLIEVLIAEAQARGELPADRPDDGALADHRLQKPSSRLLHIAWATMIGVAFLRDDELLQSVEGRISREQGARIVVESVFGVDTQEDTKAAMSFMEAPGVDQDGAVRGSGREGGPPFSPPSDRRPQESLAAEEVFEAFSQMAAAPPEDREADWEAATGSPRGEAATRSSREVPDPGPDDIISRAESQGALSAYGEPESLSPLERGLPLFEGEAPKPAARQLEIPLSEALAQYSGLQRATRSRTLLSRARILWIDDHPDWIRKGVETLEHLGASVTLADTTEAAKRALRQADAPFDVILSDIARGSRSDAGVRAIPALRKLAPDVPLIFFVGTLEPGRPPPRGSAGITNKTNELLHLVLDALEGR